MKKLLFVIGSFWLVQCVSAQSLEFGAKAGINQGSLSKNPNNYSVKSTTGFVGGIFFRVKALGLYVQPELLFSQRRGVFSDPAGNTITNTLSYVDVPVLAGYKILFFRINMGPNIQFLAGANQRGSAGTDPNFSRDNFNSVAVGLQAGVGVDLGRIQLDARYDGTIGNLGKKVVTATGQEIDYSTRSNMYQLTLGYRLLKK